MDKVFIAQIMNKENVRNAEEYLLLDEIIYLLTYWD